MVSVKKYIRLKKTTHVIIEEHPLIIRIESAAGEFAEVEDVYAMRDANNELSEGKPFYVLLDTTSGFASSTPEANKLLASKEFSGNRQAIAIIAGSLASQIVSNFFIRFNKPHTPTRVFTNEQKAIDWLKELSKQLPRL